MKSIIKISLLLLLYFLIGCDSTEVVDDGINGSGNLVTVEKDFSDFSEIRIAYAFQATITQGNTYTLSFRIDDNLIDYLEVSKSGNKLTITLDDDYSYNDVNLTVSIIMPNLDVLELSGASAADISGFESDRNFAAGLSGASRITGTLICADIYLNLSGASIVELEGEGDDLSIEASGASIFKLGSFPCTNINLSLSGASVATINTDGLLNATLSGASKLYYYGNPTLGDVSVSGASIIQRL